MADISKLSRLINGVQRNVDLSANTIVVSSIKIGAGQTELTQTILDKLILINSAADADGTFDTRYTKIADLASTANGKGASLVGVEDAASHYTATTVEGVLAEIHGMLGTGATAAGTSYSNTSSGLTATNVQTAIDEVEGRLDTVESSYIPSSQKGATNGVATLDAGGKIPVSQLPNSVMEFQGNWDASTNTPSLADGTGNIGDVYRVNVAGTQDLGSGSQSYVVGDWVVYAAGIWQKSHAGADAVLSVNGQSGVVVLTTDNINEGSTNLYFTSARAKAAAVADSITNGVTDVAPSQNAVFDALALKQAASANLDEADTFFANTDITGAEAETLTSGTQNADGLHSHANIRNNFAAGETFAANSIFAVRLAKAADAGFVAGSVYKADTDASSADNFYVVGIARNNTGSPITAGSNILVFKHGVMTATSHGFTVGEPVFLSASGALTQTPPSTTNHAVVRVGLVKDANNIEVQIQVMGVN